LPAQPPVRLIVNPVAGGGRAGRAAPAVQSALSGHGLEVSREDTRDLEHARALAREAAARGETVAALSGDGMVGAVADVLRGIPGAILGVLPGGRGNDFARVLGIPSDPVAACAVIARGNSRLVDLGEVEGRAFLGIASAGFDSDCNRIANESPAWLGNLVYAYSALRVLAGWRPARFEVELEPHEEIDRSTASGSESTASGSGYEPASAGGSPTGRSEPDGPLANEAERGQSPRQRFCGYTIAAANSGVYGGGMRLAPHARLDDGLLDVVAIEQVSKLRFLANLPKVFKGTHVQLPSVRVLRAAEVLISSDRPFTLYADGDPIAELPARVRALPGAVRVLAPEGA
jgi:diacylglycerol kinase family enzyme